MEIRHFINKKQGELLKNTKIGGNSFFPTFSFLFPWKELVIFILFVICSGSIYGQKVYIEGTVIDEKTKEPIPYVTVVFKSSQNHTYTDSEGKYQIELKASNDTLVFSYLSYQTEKKIIRQYKNQEIDIKLKPDNLKLQAITISDKKGRYSKKNNPAVDLIRLVVDHKDENRLESNKYYEYDRQDVMQLAFNNLSDSAEKRKVLKKFKFIFNYTAASELNGKRILPFYIQENISKEYFRQHPQSHKSYIKGRKTVELHKFLDADGIEMTMKQLFGEVNLYDNNIPLMSNQFVSPLSKIAPDFYKFFIRDTIEIEGVRCIGISFVPRTSSDFGFLGDIYVTDDGRYAITKVELQLTPSNGINFVNQMKLIQDYKRVDSTWCMDKEVLMLDFSLITKKIGALFGKRTTVYKNYVLNMVAPDSIYSPVNDVIEEKNARNLNDDTWLDISLKPVEELEEKTYNMLSELTKNKTYKLLSGIAMAVMAGYVETGFFDFGPLGSFISYNGMEGARFRIGGKTNLRMSRHFFLNGYVAFGTKDLDFKYQASATYSFNRTRKHLWEFPVHSLTLSYLYDNVIPGQSLLKGNPDRLLLSIRRGKTNKVLRDRMIELKYQKEFLFGFSIIVSYKNLSETPFGDLEFRKTNGTIVNKLNSSQFLVQLRYSPNEQFYQSQAVRFSFNNTSPVLTLIYNCGFKNFLGGDYTFHKLVAGFSKRWFISGFGYTDVSINAGTLFNSVPYPLLFVMQANQNYAYQQEAFSMMNFMEFVADNYVNLNIEYNFNGTIFGRIPLIKKLKLREILTFKMAYGTVTSKNIPNEVSDLMFFPHDENGNLSTFSLDHKMPYIEAGFAIDNIFKYLRIDFIKRFTYLSNPGIPKYGIRFLLHFSF